MEISGTYSRYVPYAYVVREVAPQSAKLFPRGDRHTVLENRTNHFERVVHGQQMAFEHQGTRLRRPHAQVFEERAQVESTEATATTLDLRMQHCQFDRISAIQI